MGIRKVLMALYLLGFLLVFAFSSQVSEAGEASTVKNGDKVAVEYTGTLSDGTIFDSSKNHDKPLEFTVGSGQMISGFDKAIVGMEKGEEKTFTLQPSEAYGDRNPKMMREVPRKDLPKGQEPKQGMMLMMVDPNGRKIPAKISKVGTDSVTLDLNHPLAGKALTFKIKLTQISN